MLQRLFILGLFAGLMAAAPARAQNPAPATAQQADEVHFFNDIRVQPGAALNDAVCFVCNVRAEGPVNGDVVVIFGSVLLDGQTANHDVVDFFGNVFVRDNSSVGGDLVHIVGPTHLGNNVFVGGDLVSLFGDLRTTPSTRIIGDRTVIPVWTLLIPLLLACLFVGLIAYLVRMRRRPRLVYPFPR